ncbi:MAG: AMP-binding protein [Verrucomicrobia bacterium]|nr:AMP-binding protein [Verrucomicrobiota bacterium]
MSSRERQAGAVIEWNVHSWTAPPRFNFARDVVDRWAASRPEAPALWYVHGVAGHERRLSFGEIAAASRQAARVFREAGLGPGDRVLVLLPRIPAWWVVMLGLIRLGAVPVPSTLLLTPRDIAYRIANAQTRAVITTPDGIEKAGAFDGIRFLVGGEGGSGWRDFDAALGEAGEGDAGEPTASSDPGIIYFTSATTGEPKMVLHTQASYGLAHRLTGDLWLDLRPDDVHWNLSDPGWGKAAWSSFFGPWHQGACVFILDYHGRFDPGLALRVLEDFPVTTCCLPPTALRLMIRELSASRPFPRLRHCVTAGEPLNPEVFDRWRAATGLTLHEAYGQTETVVSIGHFRRLNRPVLAGSMGQAAPVYEIAIVDENFREVPAGQEGEIAIRVQPRRPLGLFQEYWLNPEEMARQFRGDYYLTGDRAMRDADGYFWFVGRQDDVIKSSGYRIGPSEIENVLLEHPAVSDVAIIGQPDPVRGQIVKAFVVLQPGFEPDDKMRLDLQQHCRPAVAPYKYPREIEFVRELPKTISGKTRRAELRRQEAL